MAENLMKLIIPSLLGVLARWTISHFPYSGAGKPPMFGDYEAQRHWQEITINLSPSDWYINSTNNDLLYWGLDYPPLTAYHSYICGNVAQFLNSDYVALNLSRGFESYLHKLFMRYTVLVTDILIYFSASLLIYRCFGAKRGLGTFLALILYPGLYLIDYGHFQYNNVSLGLLLIGIGLLLQKRDYLGAAAFTLAINYKQMELYHALPFFFFLLARCYYEKCKLSGFIRLLKIGGTVIFVFILVWLPFLKSKNLVMAVIKRIFPITRGLFEDKVASVWCSLSIFIKFKSTFENSTMALICLVTTLVLVLPTNIQLFLRPTNFGFKCALINTSFIFFLFSFHVHEKSILLAAVPALLLVSEQRFIVTWFSFVSTISMVPLLIKDGLIFPTLSLSILILLSLFISNSNEESSALPYFSKKFYNNCFRVSVICLFSIITIILTLPPPARYPDLFTVVLSIVCCFHFCFFSLFFHYLQFTEQVTNKSKKKS